MKKCSTLIGEQVGEMKFFFSTPKVIDHRKEETYLSVEQNYNGKDIKRIALIRLGRPYNDPLPHYQRSPMVMIIPMLYYLLPKWSAEPRTRHMSHILSSVCVHNILIISVLFWKWSILILFLLKLSLIGHNNICLLFVSRKFLTVFIIYFVIVFLVYSLCADSSLWFL